MKTLITVALLLATTAPTLARYDPAQIQVSPEVGKWISSLYSEGGGRCCDEADALKDVYWESSKTASSGYALVFQGHTVDVAKEMMQIYTFDPSGYGHVPVTDNKAGFALAWLQTYVGFDGEGQPIYRFDDKGEPEFRVRCLLPGGGG